MRLLYTITALLVIISGAVALLSGCSDSHASSGTVTLYLYDRSPYTVPTNADWVAFQDGNGSWQRIAPASEGVYTAVVADARGRFGFAYFYNGDLHLQQSTLAEGAALVAFLDNGLSSVRGDGQASTPDKTIGPPGYYTINGSIGYDFPVAGTMVTMGRGGSSSQPASSYWFTVKAGLHDLVISDDTRVMPREMTWLYLERDIDVQSNMIHNVTVQSEDIITLEEGPSLTVTGETSVGNVWVNYLTANGTATALAYTNDFDGTLAFRSVPATARVSGDRYEALVNAWYKTQVACFDSPTAMTMHIPSADFDTFTVSSVVEQDLRYPVFAGLTYPGARGYFIYCSTYTHFVDVIVSAGWLAANGTTSYQVPDLTGVQGWQAAWSIAAAETIRDDDAVAFYGNAPLATSIGQHFSPVHFMLAPGEWSGRAWAHQPPV